MIKANLLRTRCHVHETMIHGSFLEECLIIFFSTCSALLFAADVEISRFDIVSTNVSTNITVTLSPSPVTEGEVCLNLHAIGGTSGATFLPGGHASTNISQTTTLQIIGTQLSSIESNMVLEAKVRDTVVASNIFTVVDADMITERKVIKTTVPAIKDEVQKETMIKKSKATEIATEAIKGKMKIREGAPIAVELKGREYIVTFGSNLPKGSLGSDYTAKVTLDAFTGSVKKILVAP